MDTIPLYTTISTEMLEELTCCKKAMEYITKGVINVQHLQLVCRSLDKAKTKHPHFADYMTEIDIECIKSDLDLVRHNNDVQANCGQSVAEEILQEEVLEACEQYLLGNRLECAKELADSAAVIFRMMEMNDDH